MAEEVRSKNDVSAGMIIYFRWGTTDAKVMAEEFYPVFKQADYTLAKFRMYLKLLIDGVGSRAFIANLM